MNKEDYEVDILQEDKGLIEIHKVCVEMNAIWRPTPCHDLGVDGQIEFLEVGTSVSTGTIVAVQSKSGPSYFVHDTGDEIKYYPKEKHIKYWGRIKLPIILVLHNPDTNLTIYTNIKPQLANQGPICVKQNSLFNVATRSDLMRISEEYLLETRPEVLLRKLSSIKFRIDSSRELNGIDLWLASLNIESNIFEISMSRYHALLEEISEDGSYDIHQRTYEFINRCISRIHSLNLVDNFWEEYESSWYDDEYVPEISVPITKLGEDVLKYLLDHIAEYFDPVKYRGQGTDPLEVAGDISKYCSHRSGSFKEFLSTASTEEAS